MAGGSRHLYINAKTSRTATTSNRHAYNYYVMGRHCVEEGKLPEARGLLAKALELDPNLGPALRVMADVEFSLGNTALARQYLDRALTLIPEDPDILFLQGNMALNARDPGKALEVYLRAEELGGPSMELSFNIGLAHLGLEHARDAAAIFKRLVEDDPAFGRAWDMLGCAHRLQKNFDGAIKAFNKALEIDPEHNDTREHLAQVLLEMGDSRRARRVLEEALSIEPRRSSSRHLLGASYAVVGEYRQAAAIWEGLIADGGATAETYHLLANAYVHLTDPKQAIQVLETLVSLYPHHMPGHLQLALLLLEQNDVKHGWEHLEQARNLDPNNPTIAHVYTAINALAANQRNMIDK